LRSFARAAVELGRSQSAISMQLKKLEQQAGTQLFVRKGRGLVPTERNVSTRMGHGSAEFRQLRPVRIWAD
jgi:hypothetical protein